MFNKAERTFQVSFPKVKRSNPTKLCLLYVFKCQWRIFMKVGSNVHLIKARCRNHYPSVCPSVCLSHNHVCFVCSRGLGEFLRNLDQMCITTWWLPALRNKVSAQSRNSWHNMSFFFIMHILTNYPPSHFTIFQHTTPYNNRLGGRHMFFVQSKTFFYFFFIWKDIWTKNTSIFMLALSSLPTILFYGKKKNSFTHFCLSFREPAQMKTLKLLLRPTILCSIYLAVITLSDSFQRRLEISW